MSVRMENYERQVRQEIHRDAAVSLGEGGAIEIRIPCSKCKNPPPWISHRMLPADAIAGKMRKVGWRINRHPLCPAHADRKHSSANENEQIEEALNQDPTQTLAPASSPAPAKELTPATASTENKPASPKENTKMNNSSAAAASRSNLRAVPSEAETATTTPTAPSNDARAAKREAIRWLDESFSVDTGRYASGVSDATISTETGLSEAQVRQLREELYGPIKEPKELAELKQDIDKLRAQQTTSNNNFEATLKRLESQRLQENERITGEISRLEKRLKKVLQDNNWEK